MIAGPCISWRARLGQWQGSIAQWQLPQSQKVSLYLPPSSLLPPVLRKPNGVHTRRLRNTEVGYDQQLPSTPIVAAAQVNFWRRGPGQALGFIPTARLAAPQSALAAVSHRRRLPLFYFCLFLIFRVKRTSHGVMCAIERWDPFLQTVN
jgi:hypothetical protein